MNPFEKASSLKKEMPIIISLVGESGCGKTYSALRLATGLTDDPKKIFLIDTENRGAMYADVFGDYQVANIAKYASSKNRPTHRPRNYIELIDIAQKMGCKVLIIDSLSDSWAGDGGVVSWASELKEQYESTHKGRAGLNVWALPKVSYAEMMNKICNSSMNIIFTYRTKEITDVHKDENGKMVIEEQKKTEIVRESGNKYNIMWELCLDGTTKKLSKITKQFAGSEWIFKPGEYLTEQTAKRMLEWQNTDKDSVIQAGRKASDKRAWYESLNPTEKYLAQKYKDEIDSANKQPKITEADL